ncbi:MAG: carboxymuconolactone decarboxylase family protein [Filomicrobium sp.]
MADVHYENLHFNPDIVEFQGLAKAMAKPVGYTAALSVITQLAQLLRLRVAQLNPCSYCLILHTQAAHDQGVLVTRVSNLQSSRDSALYSEAECAALAYTEALS